MLCEEGERGTQAFLLLEGEVDVRLPDATLRVGAGAVIGELATLDHRRTRNATVVAAGPIEVLVYDVATYRAPRRSATTCEAGWHRSAPPPDRRPLVSAAEGVHLGHLVVGQRPGRGGRVRAHLLGGRWRRR